MKLQLRCILSIGLLFILGHFFNTSAGNIGIKSIGAGSVINNGMEVPFTSLTFLSFNGATNLMTDTPSFAELGINSFADLQNINFSLTPNVVPIGFSISLSITVDIYDPNNTAAPLASLTFDPNSNISALNEMPLPLTTTFFSFDGFSAAQFSSNLVLVMRGVDIKVNSTNNNPTGAPPSFIISSNTAVPEPSALLLLSTSLAALGGILRRKPSGH